MMQSSKAPCVSPFSKRLFKSSRAPFSHAGTSMKAIVHVVAVAEGVCRIDKHVETFVAEFIASGSGI